MKKDNIMSVVLGLVVGLVVGFVFANGVNKNNIEKPLAAPEAPLSAGGAPGSNPALPPNHPALGTSSGDEPAKGAPLPQVTEAIEKAKKEPQNFDAQMAAANLYYQIERFDDAAKFFEAAAKLKPTETEPMIKAGNAYFDGEHYEEAEAWYLKALEKQPKNIDVRTDLGLTFFLREPKDLDRAIKEYKTSLAIDPAHEITLQNLALAYNAKGDKENLRPTIDKLKAVNPKNPAIKKIEETL